MLPPASRVGPFEIVALLGTGGMGEVYRARDTKLNREVALKFLPEAFARDADRLARFKREAQVLASLNHPNIATIYGFEDSDSVHAIVLELVDGPTLADRIAQGPIPLDDALPLARQIAEALEAAHEAGVVHRDLKPANIKVRDDGALKVLDFGLAKLADPAAAGQTIANATASPTMTAPAMVTGFGMVLGTAAYMSPEQGRGKSVDRRTDIWAFGCVLYEMLTGRRAFDTADTVSDAIASILTRDPDWSALPANTPPHIVRLLVRCLQKDVRRRLPHIGVVRLELDDGGTDSSAAGATAPAIVTPPARPAVVPWVTSIAALIVTGGFGAAMLVNRRDAVEPSVLRFSLNASAPVRFGSTPARGAGAPAAHHAPSPDGQRIAYVMRQGGDPPRLWVRRLDAFDGQPLVGTEDASFPFWSPDSNGVAFFANGQLKRVDVSGGPPKIICDAPAGEGGTWNRDGEIVFARDVFGGLFKVPAAGGVPAPLTRLDGSRGEIGHSWPQFLPDSRRYLYLVRSFDPEAPRPTGPAIPRFAIYVGSLDSADRTLLLTDVPRAQYASGRLLFVRDTTLMAQAFDVASLHLRGDPEVLAEQIARNPTNGRTGFAASESLLLYRPDDQPGAESILSWFSRDGRRLESVGSRAAYRAIRLSPDGKTLAAIISTRSSSNPFPPGDLWTFDLSRGGISSRLTFTPDDPKDGLAWSPDGGRIAFAAGSPGGTTTVLMQIATGGVATAEVLSQSPETKRPWAWSPNGQYIAYFQIGSSTGGDLWLQPLFGDRKPLPFVQTEFVEGIGMFSPDGQWIAYQSDKAQHNRRVGTRGSDIYVRPFPSGDKEQRISQAGGQYPQWRSDGKELFYIGSDGREVMAVPVKLGPTVEAGLPRKLFDAPTRVGGAIGQYSVAPDGSRFLMIEAGSASGAGDELAVVVNWASGLKSLER